MDSSVFNNTGYDTSSESTSAVDVAPEVWSARRSVIVSDSSADGCTAGRVSSDVLAFSGALDWTAGASVTAAVDLLFISVEGAVIGLVKAVLVLAARDTGGFLVDFVLGCTVSVTWRFVSCCSSEGIFNLMLIFFSPFVSASMPSSAADDVEGRLRSASRVAGVARLELGTSDNELSFAADRPLRGLF